MWIFTFFQVEISNIRRNLIEVEKNQLFELILGECHLDPDPVFKIWICLIRTKMDRIRNPDHQVDISLHFYPTYVYRHFRVSFPIPPQIDEISWHLFRIYRWDLPTRCDRYRLPTSLICRIAGWSIFDRIWSQLIRIWNVGSGSYHK